jgi:pimeloyl-ACP methyl ester carboxylesterase
MSGHVGALRQIDAGVLNVGYVDAGPNDGPVAILMHGWPYDVHSYGDVARMLATARYRVVVPYLRGYGTTHFLSDETRRNGEQAASAVDLIALMDALEIGRAVLGGFDCGGRTANIAAALWPQRCSGLVSVGGYLIADREEEALPLPPAAECKSWHRYYLATARGAAGYRRYRRELAELVWRTASPRWRFDAATFERSALALDNRDHVALTVHGSRWLLGMADGEPEYAELERRLAQRPTIGVPTITLMGDADGIVSPDALASVERFSGPHRHRTITGGIGHNLPQEAPTAFARAVLDVGGA